MRVTNKQAKELLKSDTVTLMSITDIHMLSADLLEARDLIKEMREEINLTLRDFEKIDEVCKMANVMPFSLTKKKLCEVMEKTKEYAE